MTPYDLGVAAGNRLPPYCKEKNPECPFPKGTNEYEDWYEGFGDGTEAYINYQYLDFGD
jgi:hypothetical protein